MPDYNTYRLSPGERATYYCVAALGALVVGELFYQSLFFSALAFPLCIPGMKFYERRLAAKRRAALAASFRDLLYSLSASFSTGRQMPEALKEGLEALRLIYKGDAPIILELEDMNRRLFTTRESEMDILDDFARRSHVEDIINFVDAYFICRATGGDMERLVVKAAEVIIEKMGVQREISAITAQKKLESKILLVIPAAILLFLQLFSPDYSAVLYGTAAGRVLMTAALAVTAAAYLWSVKLTDIEF
jgi:tight adherence protein B